MLFPRDSSERLKNLSSPDTLCMMERLCQCNGKKGVMMIVVFLLFCC